MRFNITKLFDDAKAKGSEAGKQLVDLIQYLSEFCELAGRSLRNGLTFADNFDCEVVQLTLFHDTETVVGAKKRVIGILPLRVTNVENIMIDAYGWRYNTAGEFAIKVKFSPTQSTSIQVTVVLFY